jgi:hypothetical protein
MNPLEIYLGDLAEIRSSGATVKETSGLYPAAVERVSGLTSDKLLDSSLINGI